MKSLLLAVTCSLAGAAVGAAYYRASPPASRGPEFAPFDGGRNPWSAIHTGLRRDPLRFCWQPVASSGNAGPEQCITDAALHKLELGLPIDHEPVVERVGNRMALVDGGPVWDMRVTWTDRDGPMRVCARLVNQVTGEGTTDQCRTKDELLHILSPRMVVAEPKAAPAGGKL